MSGNGNGDGETIQSAQAVDVLGMETQVERFPPPGHFTTPRGSPTHYLLSRKVGG